MKKTILAQVSTALALACCAAAPAGAADFCFNEVATGARKAIEARFPESHVSVFQVTEGASTSGDFDRRYGGKWFSAFDTWVRAYRDGGETDHTVEIDLKTGTCEVLGNRITATGPSISYDGPVTREVEATRTAERIARLNANLNGSIAELRAAVDEYVAEVKTLRSLPTQLDGTPLKTWDGSPADAKPLANAESPPDANAKPKARVYTIY